MPACLKHIQSMPNVLQAYVSVYQRMRDIFHTLAYASTIRYSVTPPSAVGGQLSAVSIRCASMTCARFPHRSHNQSPKALFVLIGYNPTIFVATHVYFLIIYSQIFSRILKLIIMYICSTIYAKVL